MLSLLQELFEITIRALKLFLRKVEDSISLLPSTNKTYPYLNWQKFVVLTPWHQERSLQPLSVGVFVNKIVVELVILFGQIFTISIVLTTYLKIADEQC